MSWLMMIEPQEKIIKKSYLYLALDLVFSILTWVIPVAYTVLWIKLGMAGVLVITLNKVNQNLLFQIYKFLIIFLIPYGIIHLVVVVIKHVSLRITGLKKSLFGTWWIELGKLFLIIPFFEKFVKSSSLEEYNPELSNRLIGWAKKNGVNIPDIKILHVSHFTPETNAFFFGIGKKEVTIILDTIFDRFSDAEIEAILAHELGHRQRKDTIQTLATLITRSLGLIFLSGWVIWFIVRNGHLEQIPEYFLLTIIYWFFTMPLYNAISRYDELLADSYAVTHIQDVAVYVSVLRKLAEDSYDVIQPPRWFEFLFYSHPSIGKRLENILAFQ